MTDEPIDVAIQKALLRQLDTPTIGYSIAYPFVTFTPTSNTAYIDARALLRAAPDTPYLKLTAPAIRRGIFQVDAVAPDGQGESPGTRIAAIIKARFWPSVSLTANGYRLLILKEPTIAAAVKDAPWVRFPVSIPYTLMS